MTSPTYGRGFVELEPRLDASFLSRINSQIERTFSNVQLNVDDDSIDRLRTNLVQADDAMEGLVRSASSADTELAQMPGHLDRSEDEARKLARTLAKIDDQSISRLNSSLGGLRSGLLGVATAAAGFLSVRSLLTGANEAIQAFADLEDSANAVNVTFGDAGATIFEFGETVAQSAGLSRQAFQQLVVPIGSMLRNFGFDAQRAADASIQLVQRAADMASVFGGDVTEALTAVQAALRGETDPIERFGASISAARVEAFALSEGLAATKGEITDAVRVQARLGLILSDTARVQGDFANTAGDLANAQRTAGAAAANFATDVGEALAPAMESLVGILPDVLEGVRQLIPTFAAGADSAAEFFNEINEGSGFRAPLQNLSAGLGTVSDSILGFTDIGDAFSSALIGDFDAVGSAVDKFNTRIARTTQRIGGQALARELDAGADGLTAVANALSFVGREQENIEVFEESYRAFAIQANLTAPDLLAITGFLRDNAVAAGLSAAEVNFLEEQFARLRNTISPVGNEVNQAARAMGQFGEATQGAVGPFGVFVDTVETEANRLGTFTGQLQAATNNVAEALDPFKKADERIKVSAREFFKNIVAQINQQASFQANVARLIGAGFDDVAREIAEAGPGANQAAEEFLNNLDLAEKAESLLDGQGTDIANQVGSELAQQLSSSELSVQQQRAFVELMEDGIFSNSQVRRAIQSGTLGTAREIAAGVENAFGGVDFNIEIDLSAEGREARASFFLGLNDAQPGEVTRLRDSISDTLGAAIIRKSPPKLFMDAGIESAEAFWQGFGVVPLEFPSLDLGRVIPTGTLEVMTDAGISNGPLIGQVTVNNPIGEPTEDSLQAALIEVAVSPTVNRLVSAGSSR